jgi:hypothetical protein
MGKREKYFLFPMQEMGVETQTGVLHLLVFYFLRAGGYTWSKIMDLDG